MLHSAPLTTWCQLGNQSAVHQKQNQDQSVLVHTMGSFPCPPPPLPAPYPPSSSHRIAPQPSRCHRCAQPSRLPCQAPAGSGRDLLSCHVLQIIDEHNQPDMVLRHQLCFGVQVAPCSWLQGEGGFEEANFFSGKSWPEPRRHQKPLFITVSNEEGSPDLGHTDRPSRSDLGQRQEPRALGCVLVLQEGTTPALSEG